jgi:hypothetical protein
MTMNFINQIQREPIDGFLIVIQYTILSWGIFLNLLGLIKNYFDLVSPLIESTFFLRYSKSNIALILFYVALLFISTRIMKDYQRKKVIFLIVLTLICEWIFVEILERINLNAL